MRLAVAVEDGEGRIVAETAGPRLVGASGQRYGVAHIDIARDLEHYEMARYGALAGWAMQLGMKDAASLLNQTLQEEMNAEKLVTQIAKSKVDITAATKNAA
jgi:ferritin-like metal-binding protein YciE